MLEAFERVPAANTTVSGLAAATELPRPVVRRILLTLGYLGYAQQEGSVWRLRPTILRFATWFTDSNPLLTAARPHAERLARSLGELVAICQLDDSVVRIVLPVRVDHYLAVRAEVGQVLPLHATSPGHVLLAHSHLKLDEPLAAYTERTITSIDELNRIRERVRAQGFAVCDQELEIGLIDAAAPIYGPSGAVVGTISTAASLARRSAEQVRRETVPLLRRVSAAITQSMERIPAAR